MRTIMMITIVVAAMASSAPLGAQSHFEDRAARFSFSGVEFPAVVDTFAVMVARRYPNPGLGVQLEYRSPLVAGAFDVYVYPFRDDDSADSEAALVQREFENALKSVEVYPRNDLEVTIEGSDSITVVTPAGTEYRGWVGEATLRRGTDTRTSLLYLFAKDGEYMKYRISHDRAQRQFLASRVDTFIAETLDGIVVRDD